MSMRQSVRLRCNEVDDFQKSSTLPKSHGWWKSIIHFGGGWLGWFTHHPTWLEHGNGTKMETTNVCLFFLAEGPLSLGWWWDDDFLYFWMMTGWYFSCWWALQSWMMVGWWWRFRLPRPCSSPKNQGENKDDARMTRTDLSKWAGNHWKSTFCLSIIQGHHPRCCPNHPPSLDDDPQIIHHPPITTKPGYRAAFKIRGLYKIWMANAFKEWVADAFKICGGQCF